MKKVRETLKGNLHTDLSLDVILKYQYWDKFGNKTSNWTANPVRRIVVPVILRSQEQLRENDALRD